MKTILTLAAVASLSLLLVSCDPASPVVTPPQPSSGSATTEALDKKIISPSKTGQTPEIVATSAEISTSEVRTPETPLQTATANETNGVGQYIPYDIDSVKASLAAGKKVALFFHASWCPPCRALDGAIKNDTIPSDLVIYKVDYDSNIALRQQYKVTSQHTIVTLASDMSAIKVQIGAKNLAEILKMY